MQIVIEISNYELEWIKNVYGIPNDLNTVVAEMIMNGIPLPEGHGRLIDADVMKKGLHGVDDAGTFIYIDKLLDKFDDAPTIIEADKEVEEEC